MTRLLVTAVAALLMGAPAARAIDCIKAARPLERMICADPQLRKAHAVMGTAYAALLRGTDDAEIRAMPGAQAAALARGAGSGAERPGRGA